MEVGVTKFSFWSLALLAGVSCAVVACGSDDDSGGSGGSGGKSAAGAGGKGSSGKTGVAEGGASGAGEEAGAAGAASSLYERLNGHAGIQAAIGAIVTAELADSDIASYFAPNLNDPTHLPQAGDIEECFTALLGQAAGGPEKYPMTTASGFTCRSMPAAHAALHIGGDTFDNFVTIAGGVLKAAKVADSDIATIALVLNGTKTSIIDKNAPASGPCVVAACDVAEAGAGGSK